MAAAFDAVSVADHSSTALLSWTHTPVGTPTGVAVIIYCFNNEATSVTYGGVSMTLEVTKTTTNSRRLQIFGLAAPLSGARTVEVTMFSGATVRAIAVTVTGGDTTDVFSGNASANGTSTTASVDCASATGELVVDGMVQSSGSGAPTVGSGQTDRSNGTIGGDRIGVSTEAGAGTVTMSWSLTDSTAWASVAASFKAAAGGGGGLNAGAESSYTPGGMQPQTNPLVISKW